jgi:hypothetical protein
VINEAKWRCGGQKCSEVKSGVEWSGVESGEWRVESGVEWSGGKFW